MYISVYVYIYMCSEHDVRHSGPVSHIQMCITHKYVHHRYNRRRGHGVHERGPVPLIHHYLIYKSYREL